MENYLKGRRNRHRHRSRRNKQANEGNSSSRDFRVVKRYTGIISDLIDGQFFGVDYFVEYIDGSADGKYPVLGIGDKLILWGDSEDNLLDGNYYYFGFYLLRDHIGIECTSPVFSSADTGK